MDLNELPIRVVAPLLIQRRLCRSRANDRIRALTKNCADATGRDDHRVRREGTHFHRAQIHCTNATANPIRIQHRRKKFPRLELRYLAFRLITSHLLIERIKKLLAGSRPSKCCPMMQSASEASEIEQALRRAIKRHAHAVEQINDSRR